MSYLRLPNHCYNEISVAVNKIHFTCCEFLDFVLTSIPYMVRIMIMNSSSVSQLLSVESVVSIKSLRMWLHRECNVARPKTWDLSVLCSFGARKRMSVSFDLEHFLGILAAFLCSLFAALLLLHLSFSL
ncbi:hypothetical protein BDC45DRAFT_532400 [Circinella umbellata]|nr:hypothetical protein BDC45DRAFT_532400 [Circinella umbellata]